MEKKKRPQLKSAADVLQKLFKEGGAVPDSASQSVANEYKRWSLIQNWPTVVGQALSERTFPVKYIRGTLYIWCSSASGVQHYYFISNNVLEKVNQHLGIKWVTKVVWTQNKGFLDSVGEKERQYISKLLRS
ncbi:MAG: DUF721 domain-containing protein [Bdellovibrionaceae bacterium]|nr:DUF721 domain-containing protein [Pseudobdellovibrionaceae bacterium]